MQKKNAQHPSAKTFVGFWYLPTLTYTGPITNLSSFCRERHLDAAAMSDLARQQKLTHKLWTFYQGESEAEQKRLRIMQKRYLSSVNGKAKQWPGLVHIETREHTGTIVNLKGWCRTRNLNYLGITRVMYGEQYAHNNWKLDSTWKK